MKQQAMEMGFYNDGMRYLERNAKKIHKINSSRQM